MRIVLVLLRRGLWRALGAEKLGYFFGLSGHRLHLSRRDPPYRHLGLVHMLVSLRHARAVADWLHDESAFLTVRS